MFVFIAQAKYGLYSSRRVRTKLKNLGVLWRSTKLLPSGVQRTGGLTVYGLAFRGVVVSPLVLSAVSVDLGNLPSVHQWYTHFPQTCINRGRNENAPSLPFHSFPTPPTHDERHRYCVQRMQNPAEFVYVHVLSPFQSAFSWFQCSHGPVFIGLLFNVLLHGILCVQMYNYVRMFKRYFEMLYRKTMGCWWKN